MHKCLVSTIDYGQVDRGWLACRPERGGCGRTWTFVRGKGWMPSPHPSQAVA